MPPRQAPAPLYGVSGVLDANGCGALQEKYGLVPNVSWGTMPLDVQALWDGAPCQPERICKFWIAKYDIATFDGYGSLRNQLLQQSYDRLDCYLFIGEWSEVS